MNAEFVVFDSTSSFDAIMRHPLIFSLRAAISLYYYSLKFPTPHGVGEIKENKDLAEKCQMRIYPASLNTPFTPRVYMVCSSKHDLDPLHPRSKTKEGEPVEDLDKISICENDSTKEIKVGYELQPQIGSHLTYFLRRNLDVFAWSHDDMEGIDPRITYHRLNVDPSV